MGEVLLPGGLLRRSEERHGVGQECQTPIAQGPIRRQRGHAAGNGRVQLGLAPCEFTAPPVCVEANATNATVIPGGRDVTCVTTTLASADTTKVYVTAYEGQKPPVQLGTSAGQTRAEETPLV